MKDFLRVLSYAGDHRPLMTKAIICLTLSVLFTLAQRLSSVTGADNIVLLEKGRVADQGRHGGLLSRAALYQKLWNAHVESMDWDIGEAHNE